MRYQLPYGDGQVEFSLTGKAKVLVPQKTKPLSNPEGAIRRMLSNPIDSLPFTEMMHTKGKVAMIVNDETRVARTEIFLPMLVSELNKIGIKDHQIFAMIANGTHRPMTRKEIRKKVSAFALERIKVYNHHSKGKDMVYVGKTRAGTEVVYNKRVIEADKIILTGSIIYHFFAGYGGGRKALFPGVAAYESIEQNHILTLDPRSTFGTLIGNPIEEDFQEAVAFRKPDFLLNTVLDENKKIVGVVAGDYRKAHEKGCQIVDQVFGYPVPEAADLVIASCGGYSKDINLFQAHKTMENAVRVTKKGGVTILVAECRDGIGPLHFVNWLKKYNSYKEMEEKLFKKFEFGAHKAFFLSRLTEKADVFLVSSLHEKSLKGLFVKPVASVEEALKRAFEKLGPRPLTYILPQGGLVFPWVEKKTSEP
jgi:nickel-dependent lactate racemase